MARKIRSEESLQSALLRFGDAAFRICYMHTKSPKMSRELLEDVFTQYRLCTKEFKSEEDERFWVLRTTHRTCMDYYAKKLRKKPSNDQIQHAARSLDFVVSDELCTILNLHYGSLTMLALCYGEEESITYAAKITGTPTALLQRRMQKALKVTGLPEDELKEWIQTIFLPDDIRSRIQYNIQNTMKDKHFGINSRAAAFKRGMDRAVPYVALGVVCFGLLAVAAVRFGWLGVEYVRTPMNDDASAVSTETGTAESSGTETSVGESGSGAITASFSYFVPDEKGLTRYNCTMEADASVLVAKMAEKGVFSSDVVLSEARFLKNGKNVTTLKSGEMPDIQLYFSEALQTELDAGSGTEILEAVSRTILAFYETGNITPAKLEIFSGGKPVTVNGEEVNCTPLMYGELPVSAVINEE